MQPPVCHNERRRGCIPDYDSHSTLFHWVWWVYLWHRFEDKGARSANLRPVCHRRSSTQKHEIFAYFSSCFLSVVSDCWCCAVLKHSNRVNRQTTGYVWDVVRSNWKWGKRVQEIMLEFFMCIFVPPPSRTISSTGVLWTVEPQNSLYCVVWWQHLCGKWQQFCTAINQTTMNHSAVLSPRLEKFTSGRGTSI